MDKRAIIATLAALAAVGVGIVAGTPAPIQAGESVRTPLYIPAPAFGMDAPCGGDHQLVSLSYYPKPDEGTFIAKFRASGGPSGGYVVMSIGGDYEEGVNIPANSGFEQYIITVKVPVPVARAPVLVYAGGPPCGPALTKYRTVPASSVTVKDLNLFAQP